MKSQIYCKIERKLSLSYRRLLKRIFKFDNWHLVPLTDKIYAKDIISQLNRMDNRNYYLEIGCGLGDIIRNVKYKDRVGLDRENMVLSAARFQSVISLRRNIHYKTFTFPEDQIAGKFDAILLVNWIHNIEPEILKNKLEEYFKNNLNNKGIIIIDTVQDSRYKYNHNISYLTQNMKIKLSRIGEYENNRETWIISKQSGEPVF